MNNYSILMVGLIALCGCASFANWRHAIYLTIVLDAVRDPIRKLAPNQPVWMSQAISIVWVCIFLNCISRNYRIIPAIRRTFPRMREATFLLFAGLIPGAVLSLIMYRNGWILVFIGILSYVAPILGLLIGVAFSERITDLHRFMRIYVVANGIVLIGSIAEHQGWSWPGLGGLIGFEWIRHMPGVLVRMVSGFFRSPDIAGFHAAHVVVFSMILCVPRKQNDFARPYWLAPGLFALYTLFLAGRRKMLCIPVIFLIVWVFLDLLRKRKGSKPLILFIGMSLIAVGGGAFYLIDDNSELDHHQIYMSTTVFDIAPKLYEHSFQGSMVTISQSGIMGSGLGIATQGVQYAGIERSQVWQEDGVSRLFKELGVIGVFFFCAAALQYFREFLRAFRIPLMDSSRITLQNIGLAIFVANAACFIVSHQHISGDAANGILPLLFLGGLFGHILAELRVVRKPHQAVLQTNALQSMSGRTT